MLSQTASTLCAPSGTCSPSTLIAIVATLLGAERLDHLLSPRLPGGPFLIVRLRQ